MYLWAFFYSFKTITMLFERKNITAPGTINAFLDGRFQEFNIDDLTDDQKKQLYNAGCEYVQPTIEGRKVLFPDEKNIGVAPLNIPAFH